VRTGKELTTPETSERLATGARVKELELIDERLHFEKLTGAGPSTGWVSLKLKDTPLVAKVAGTRHWEVIGGGSKGGIVVRTGQDTASPEAPERLAKGARVRELEMAGDRLRYELVTGSGPSSGWVSLKFKDSPLLTEVVAELSPMEAYMAAQKKEAYALVTAGETATLKLPEEAAPVTGRKVRVLALPSGPSNTNILKFQTMTMKKAFGSDCEWVYLDPPTPWEPIPGATHPSETERPDFEKMIAKSQPITQWYSYSYHMKDPTESDGWEQVPECCEYIMEFIKKEGPFDAILSFSAGASMVSMLIEHLRRKGEALPWRLTMLFNGANVDDHRYQFKETCSSPIIYVVGGEKDNFFVWGLTLVSKMYTNMLVLGHEDGHQFPMSAPRSTEIYSRMALELRRCCGLPAS